MSDYTDIQPELDDFENAVYGEEVRDSMISAIKKIHDSAAGAPDASSATAGQVLTADGTGGHYWGAGGKGIPTSVKQAIISLLKKAAISPDLETDPSGETPYDVSGEINVLDEWASTRVVGIRLNPNTISFTEGDSVTISAELIPSDADDDILWSSSDDSVAIVAEGVVTPVANGTCKIFASVGNVSASCDVTVSGFCTITNDFDEYITNSNTAMGGRIGETYSGTLTTTKGVIETASVSVVMDEVDVTESVYSNGNIFINNITGDIVITASLLDTTAQIAKDGYAVRIDTSLTGNDSVIEYAVGNAGILIPYPATAWNPKRTTTTFKGKIVQGTPSPLRWTSAAVPSIYALDSNGNAVIRGTNGYADSSNCYNTPIYVNTDSDEGTGAINSSSSRYTGGIAQMVFLVDTRYLDDDYLYVVETGEILFAGKNTPYYSMTNISQAPV